ncbi:MAG TPA: hypothetical protein VM716_16030 [Gemmatimonadales bacterium]|nr:hypothetical protein [Gemmatimonadales bacterium]
MTAFRFSTLAATVGLVVTGCRGSSGPKVTLRYHPPAGAAYHYTLEQQNAMRVEGGPLGGAMPEQAFTMRIYYTQRVNGPAQGGVAVTTTFDSTTLEAPGMGAGAMQPALDRMRGLRSDMVYDERMQVLSAAFGGLAGAPSPVTEQMGTSIKSMALRLPEAPVGVGDSWVSEQEMPLGAQLNASNPIKARTKLTVREIQVAGPDTSVVLAVETSFPGDPIELSQMGRHATMRLSGGLTGEQVFSLLRSVPVRATMAGTMRMKVTSAGQSDMSIAMRQQTSLQLADVK